jgi:nitroreductase
VRSDVVVDPSRPDWQVEQGASTGKRAQRDAFRGGLLALKQTYRMMRNVVRVVGYSTYDAARYFRYSASIRRGDNGVKSDALITKYYHMLEKGLSLRTPRPGFGLYPIAELESLLSSAFARGQRSDAIGHAVGALAAYAKFNRDAGSPNPAAVTRMLAAAAEQGYPSDSGATKLIRRSTLEGATAFDAEAFFSSRSSVRQFTSDPVDEQLLAKAVSLAQFSPSVCNRQSAFVHFATDPGLKRKILALQDGNRGFGDQAPVIAVITAKLDHFVDPTERYQCWIDGGMFAMSLLLALHSLRLGACPLNWSAKPENDKALHKAASIPSEHSIIMLVAIGHIPDVVTVARSPRKQVASVMRFLPP